MTLRDGPDQLLAAVGRQVINDRSPAAEAVRAEMLRRINEKIARAPGSE